ncbi:diacylglycerol/lipid kinase family protein [Halalkalibacter krulwichiae]|uniref:Putative lipid kinase YtlR n=1 Tax=Halalkalibacter krulwichiae TaxID=199441 RepID=A0A1X9MFQ3_9BACI|nr:diacylglycerol kinase family protein [Halalkalibacter krulwichiae]ARK31474.1 Putative lipid kinase YtlR [Halalkalibacter krulwichiae]
MYYFIVNKTSGNGRSVKVWSEIEKILQRKEVEYSVVLSENKIELYEFITDLRQSNETVDGVIALGGDGTIHEIINHLLGMKVPFTVLPTGSGNDFARARGITKNYEQEIDKILKKEHQKIDLLKVGDKHCMTVVGIGFDGKVAKEANELKLKKWLGGLAYLIIIFKVLICYKPTYTKLMLNQEERIIEKVWLIAIANHPYYGGGMKICPQATSDDGKLDICIIHSLPKWRLLFLLAAVFKGKHVDMSGVEYLQVESIEVETNEPLYVTADGEIMGQTPTAVTVNKNALHVLS